MLSKLLFYGSGTAQTTISGIVNAPGDTFYDNLTIDDRR